jgi:hypothetical protein
MAWVGDADSCLFAKLSTREVCILAKRRTGPTSPSFLMEVSSLQLKRRRKKLSMRLFIDSFFFAGTVFFSSQARKRSLKSSTS